MSYLLRLGLVAVVFGCFTPTPVTAQRKAAFQHALDLKANCLLVRLNTYTKKLELLREAGREAEAKALETQLQYKNEALATAFNRHFDFCPVYFFWSEHAAEIPTGQYASVVLDSSLQVLGQPLNFEQLYIAGISYLALHNDFDRSEQEGLILMDRNFDYLPDPFPNVPVKYFQKWVDAYELPGAGAQTLEAEMVIKLNEKLHRFHQKALRKLKKKG